jgi:very-short-patch-repair endonuclease
MVIIDRAFKGAEDLHAYLRERAGFKEATQEEKENWRYHTPLWTSPSNFIGCDLIHKGKEVGKVIAVSLRPSLNKQSTTKVMSLQTESGCYKFSNCDIRFKNALYDGREQVMNLHPTRAGAYLWSRGFVIGEKDYKSLYYQTEEYQKKYGKTMVKRHGVVRPYQSKSIRAKASKAIKEKFGVDWFLTRGTHYSAITNTMIEKYGVENIIHSSDFLERCGQCTSKGEQEVVQYLVSEFSLQDSMHYTTGDTRQAVITDPETYGSYQVDFMNERLGIIVEFFGDYWHCHPDFYKKSYIHDTNGKSAGEIWAADKKRLQRLKELTGFEVLVVWERDWMNNKEAEKERLRAVVLELSSQNQE